MIGGQGFARFAERRIDVPSTSRTALHHGHRSQPATRTAPALESGRPCDVAKAVVRLAHDAQRASCAASIARCLAQRERCGGIVKGTLCIAQKELKVCERRQRLALAASILRPPAERQRPIVIGQGFLRFTETLYTSAMALSAMTSPRWSPAACQALRAASNSLIARRLEASLSIARRREPSKNAFSATSRPRSRPDAGRSSSTSTR